MQHTKILVCLFAIFACALASYNHYNENNQADDDFYKFEYGVEDLNTGDIKNHHETKVGKEVSGIYSLKEADGTTRIVRYNAGPHTGFNAVVERVGVAQHPTQQQSHQTESLADSEVGAQDAAGWAGEQYEWQGQNLLGGSYGQKQQW